MKTKKIEPKLVSGEYNHETKISKVVLLIEGKEYTGYATVHPDDYDRESDYFGCNIAELRAIINYMKELRKEKRIDLLAYSLELAHTSKYNLLRKKDLKKKVRKSKEELTNLKNSISNIYKMINQKIDSYNLFMNKINEEEAKCNGNDN